MLLVGASFARDGGAERAAALLGVLPTADGDGALDMQVARLGAGHLTRVRRLNFERATALRSALAVVGAAADAAREVLPCGVEVAASIDGCGDAPGERCSHVPSYSALLAMRSRLAARGARPRGRCAARGLGLAAARKRGELDPSAVAIVVHACAAADDGGCAPTATYHETLLRRLARAEPAFGATSRAVFVESGDAFTAAALRSNATLRAHGDASEALLSAVCMLLTADVLISSGAPLAPLVAAFAPRGAPLLLEERRAEARAAEADASRTRTDAPAATHFFAASDEGAVPLLDGVPQLPPADVAARLQRVLRRVRARGEAAAAGGLRKALRRRVKRP